MKTFVFAFVCFVFGFLFVIVANVSPFIVCLATLVCVAAYPTVRRFAQFVSDVVTAHRERSEVIRTFIGTSHEMDSTRRPHERIVEEIQADMNGNFPKAATKGFSDEHR